MGFIIPTEHDKPASFRGDLNLEAGEILLGSFYLNLKQDPFRLRSQGAYEVQGHRFSSLSVRFQAPTLGEGTITGTFDTLDGPRGEARVALGPISNERAFDLFVKEPFGHISPVLKKLSINGETSITGLICGSRRGYSIRGLVETSAVDLTIPTHEIKAKGVKIKLPFSLNHPNPDGTRCSAGLNNSVTGFVQGDWIQWKSRKWRDVTMPMTLMENTFLFPPHLKIPILGGAVILEGAKIQDPFRKTMEIIVGLRLDRLDFSEVTKAFVPFAIPGSLEGNFSEIRVSADSLATRGNLTIHALGGQIEVSNLQGSTLFSRLRRVSMDVLIKSIDLEVASQSFKFGQMGGTIQGGIRDLAFSFGQPERFELEIRSVKKKGVRQYVNAEAVNNLSILSTGSGFSFKRSALQFFQYFPYAKLGIYCKLENDVFTLRGTIHQNGVEYLIKRGLFRGIDVINQNPENRIRWRQMLSRLKAIGRGRGAVEVSTQK